MFRKRFNSAKCKISLGLTIARIKVLRNQRQAAVKLLRREVSKLLEAGQDQIARTQVEHVIREEKTLFAYDLIEVYCKQIADSLNIIESKKKCPINLKEAIAGLIFASQRCPQLTDLLDIQKRLEGKYGKEFSVAALELRPSCGVGSVIVEKLSVISPDIETKLRVLTAIASEHGINWEPRSYEESLKKPQDDIVNDPNSFLCTRGSESNKEFPSQRSHYDEPSIKPSEKEVQNPETYFASCSTNSALTNEFESGTSGMDNSLKSARCNMEFKDASSAAFVAVEAAEMAIVATRIAAKFASRETGFRQLGFTHDETSYTDKEVPLTSLPERVEVGIRDPSSNRMKTTLTALKFGEHHSGETMQDDSRGKKYGNSLLLDDQYNLSFLKDAIRNNNYDKGSMTEKIEAQSGPEKIKSPSFGSSGSTSHREIDSRLWNRKDNFHVMDGLETDHETGDQIGKLPGSSSSTIVFDDYGTNDDDYIDIFRVSNDNTDELHTLKSKSLDFSVHQEPWLLQNNEYENEEHRLLQNNKEEIPIEGHLNLRSVSMKTVKTGNAEDVMGHSSSKSDESLSPNFDKIDDFHAGCERADAKATFNVLTYPRIKDSLNLHSTQEDHSRLELKLDNLTGGLRNKGLLCPPYIKTT